MATYINGLCLPLTFLGANTPYVPITKEGLEADIAKLEALLAQANDCLITCEGRTINISSLTMDGTNVVAHLVGTTAGGYISGYATTGEEPIPPIANPVSQEFSMTNFIGALGNGNITEFGMYIYRDAAGNDLCDNSEIEVFIQDGITIPEKGAPTLFKTPAVFTLPACAGTLSYTELYEGGADSIVASVDSVTGVVTMAAQTLPSGTGRYYYYVTCTVLGVPTVIATCYLEVTNA